MMLPLILTLAVALSGALMLADRFWLAPRRAESELAPLAIDYARSFFPVLLIVWLLRSFVAEPFQIPSESMVPELEIGDFVLVNKFAYGLRLPVLNTKVLDIGEPQRGDVMVFVPPHKELYLIKRVIGLPGDRVRYDRGALFVNGERVRQEAAGPRQRTIDGVALTAMEYLEVLADGAHRIHRIEGRRLRTPQPQEWLVPADSYFMLGDNRDRSEDSRVWGYASESRLVGKAVAIWMHKPPGWHWPSFARSRWLEREPVPARSLASPSVAPSPQTGSGG
jgi:signal peptidase I